MASSFSAQIPAIVHLLQKLSPKSVLDIGKGFGKYGFLIHEYLGIDNQKRLNPSLSMAQQIRVKIDASEVDKDLMLPHLFQFYNEVFFGDIFSVYKNVGNYDLILMIDVIEHLDKEKSIELLQYFLGKNSQIIVATPIDFFNQDLYESEFEHHVSHWTLNDFKKLGFTDCQYFDGGAVYLLAKQKIDLRGFGNSTIKKLRRIARAIKNEL
jgi:SAM-dependent methyltransferase